MSARGLHMILGARFHHAHPECPLCAYYLLDGPRCIKKRKILCCAKERRCRDYVASTSRHRHEHNNNMCLDDDGKCCYERWQPAPRDGRQDKEEM